MKLDLDGVPHGRSEIEISDTLKLDWAEDRPEMASVQGVLTVENFESRVMLSGTLQSAGTASCGRCLEDFEISWAVPVEIMVLCGDDTDEGESETMVIRQTTGVVDLTEALRECLILAYPPVLVCREDCQGICAQCGIDLNKGSCTCAEEDVDPRWAGLDALEE